MSPAFAGICEGQERKAEVEWEHLQYYGDHRAILAKAKSQGKTKREYRKMEKQDVTENLEENRQRKPNRKHEGIYWEHTADP